MCVLPPEKLGAGMSFLQKQNRQEPKGGKKRKKEKPNQTNASQVMTEQQELWKEGQGKFPEKIHSAQVGIPLPHPSFGISWTVLYGLVSLSSHTPVDEWLVRDRQASSFLSSHPHELLNCPFVDIFKGMFNKLQLTAKKIFIKTQPWWQVGSTIT